jgi:SRSO17 transposase
VANCQVGVSVHAVTDRAACPLDWRRFLPESWDADAERRRKAQVPDRERHRPTWQLALELLEELAGWELVPPVVLADAADGEVGEFRLGLEQRRLADVVQVPGTIGADPEDVAPTTVPSPGRGSHPSRAPASRAQHCDRWCWPLASGRPPRWPGATAPTGSGLARGWWRWGAPGRAAAAPGGPWRGGAGALAAGRMASGRARAGHLLARDPARDHPRQQLVGLAKLRWRVEHDDRELQDALGLDHFAGRSWPGWQHHVTLVSVAHGFVTLERLDPTVGASA